MHRFIRRCLPVALILLSACAQLPARPALSPGAAVPVATGAALDLLTAPAESLNPGASGFRLIDRGPEAFALRAHSAKVAVRSLDVQTYIWHDDLTGRFLGYLLLEAADRGVKVRLLLDDLDARGKNAAFAAFEAHPNIEVRLFNPLASRNGALRYLADWLGDGKRLNHRMHNKSWIADNRVALVGGRNLGDEYFGASDGVNFVDLDFVMVGPVVRDVSSNFDRYWNSSAAYPAAVLSPDAVTPAALENLRGRLGQAAEQGKSSPYAELLRRDDAIARLVTGDWPLVWSHEYQFVSDDPLKSEQAPGIDRSEVLRVLRPAAQAAERDQTLISPYFVPGELGTASMVAAAQSGRRVRILTNSLAANDVAAVHGGYSQYREDLLKGGVQLWELKPIAGEKTKSSMFGSTGASLHTKAMIIDGRKVFVGSYNIDPRSTALNCEQGVLVTSEALGEQLGQIFDRQSSGALSWNVSMVDGELSWNDGTNRYDSDPQASAGRRFQAWLARVFPIESQL